MAKKGLCQRKYLDVYLLLFIVKILIVFTMILALLYFTFPDILPNPLTTLVMLGMIFLPYFYVSLWIDCTVTIEDFSIEKNLIKAKNLLNKDIVFEIEDIQDIRKMPNNCYVISYLPSKRFYPSGIIIDWRSAKRIDELKNKVYNRDILYIIDYGKIKNLKSEVIFEEDIREWRKIKRNRLLATYIPVVGCIGTAALFVWSLKADVYLLVGPLVVILGGLFGSLLVYRPVKYDYLKARQRFVITKDGIYPPLPIRKQKKYTHSIVVKDVNRHFIPMNDIKRIYLAERKITNYESHLPYEVWVIETKDGYEYYILPKFKKHFLRVLDKFATPVNKGREKEAL